MREIDELIAKWPRYPVSKLIRAAVLRDGLKFTPNLVEIGEWALHQSNWVLEYGHFKHARAKLEELAARGDLTPEEANLVRNGYVQTPAGFRFKDYTYIQVAFNDASQWEIRTEWLGSTFSTASMGGERYFLYYGDERIDEVFFEPKPRWLMKRTSDGRLFANVMQLISAQVMNACMLRHCEYFNTDEQCRFCSMTGGSRALRQEGVRYEMALRPEHAVEAFREAQAETGVKMILLSGGSLLDIDREIAAYARVVEALARARRDMGCDTVILVGSSAFPKEACRELKKLGADVIMFDLEVWDPRIFPVVCPGKAKYMGRDTILGRLQDAVEIFGKGNVGTNFVLGAELAQPGGFSDLADGLASWRECFAWLLGRDIVPMCTIWQPGAGSKYEGQRTAPIEYLLAVGAERRAAMKKYDMFTHCIDMWK